MIFSNGNAGLLVEEHDVKGMDKNMLALLKDKNLAIEMGNAGKINIQKNFSMKKHIDKLNELVKKAYAKT